MLLASGGGSFQTPFILDRDLAFRMIGSDWLLTCVDYKAKAAVRNGIQGRQDNHHHHHSTNSNMYNFPQLTVYNFTQVPYTACPI